VATQNPELRKKFTGSPDHAVTSRFVAQEVRELMASLASAPSTMIGHTEINLSPPSTTTRRTASTSSKILYQPDVGDDVGRSRRRRRTTASTRR
jgi:hypothetical protein